MYKNAIRSGAAGAAPAAAQAERGKALSSQGKATAVPSPRRKVRRGMCGVRIVFMWTTVQADLAQRREGAKEERKVRINARILGTLTFTKLDKRRLVQISVPSYYSLFSLRSSFAP
jgi:hypothetical protein